MGTRKRLNLALMRAAGILLATVRWTWDDVCEFGGEAIVSLVNLLGNVLWLAFALVVGPFLQFHAAWKLRHHITEKTTWTKPKKQSTK